MILLFDLIKQSDPQGCFKIMILYNTTHIKKKLKFKLSLLLYLTLFLEFLKDNFFYHVILFYYIYWT